MNHIIDCSSSSKIKEKTSFHIELINNYINNIDTYPIFFSLDEPNQGLGKIFFQHEIKSHLLLNGFNLVVKDYLSKNISEISPGGYETYTLLDWIKGDSPNIQDNNQLRLLGTTLANYHKASKGFYRDSLDIKATKIVDLKSEFQKMKIQLETIEKKINHEKKARNFNFLYLQSTKDYQNMINSCLKDLEDESYNNLCEIAINESGFCHNKFEIQNIITSNEDFYVINCMSSKCNIRIYDISYLITTCMNELNWSIDKASIVLDGYSQVLSLSKEEYKVLYSLFKIPHDYLNIVNNYYNHSDEEQLICLENILLQKNNRRIFLEQYKNNYIS